MKKILFSIAACVLISLGVNAVNISMPWNEYAAAPKTAYQAKDASKVSTYTPQVGDVVTVTIAGTANQNINSFQVALVDDAPPSYWTELAGFKALGTVTKDVPFSFSVNLNVTATGTPKIVFDGLNATLATTGTGGTGAGTSITLNLTTYTVVKQSIIPGATVLTDNGNGAKQGTFTKLPATPVVKVGDQYKVQLKGVSDVAATEFQVVFVDESADASTPYWTELSAFTDFTPTGVSAGPAFDLSATVTITKAPIGTSAKKQNIALLAKSTSTMIQLSLTEFSVTFLSSGVNNVSADVLAKIGDALVNPQGLDVEILSVTGAAVAKSTDASISIASLPKGVYIAKTSQGILKFIK